MNILVQKLKVRNPDLKEAEIEGLLYILQNSSDLSNNELIRKTGITKEVVKTFKESIGQYLVKTEKDEIALNEEGSEVLSKIEFKPYAWTLVDLGEKALEEKLTAIREKYHLEPKREFDQFFATPFTSIAKARIIKEKGMLEGKNIALLGDDDLVSISLNLLLPGGGFKVTVFDIDPELLSTIKGICSDLGINNVQTAIWDVRRDPNREFLNMYDVVMTDPPYTKSGISLFLKRGIQLLKKFKNYSGEYIFLFYGGGIRSPEKTLKVQEVIKNLNLVIEDKIDKFARYYGAETVGSASSLYVLKTTPHTNVPEKVAEENIYTYEKEKEDKFPYVDHWVFKIFSVPGATVKSKKTLLKVLGEFCNKHKLKVIDTKVTQFKGLGLTITFILANSNLVVHTWPEYNSVHIDLITCSPIYNEALMAETLSKQLGTQKIEARKLE